MAVFTRIIGFKRGSVLKKGAIFLIVTAAVAGLAWLGSATVSKAREWASKITVAFSGIGKPTLQSGIVSIPISTNIFNPAPVPIPVSNLVVNVLASTGKSPMLIASTKPTGSFIIQPGNNKLDLMPQVDLNSIKNLVAGDLVNELKNIFNSGSLPKISLRLDSITTVGGVAIPATKNFTLDLNTL